ncbi:sterile alpha motif domain-containing protein 1 [Amia ocellicauda]|uniref:sterile alpha motif domain-containing protein 1 n=1 Tax=Amia ocellicauda TaxID=2972642 RepID=UPI0034642163
MSEPKYRDWILETIDSLRSRKARPDLERICRMVRRRHGSDPDRTRSELEKLIQEQTVLKVSYKGSISYRNAAKVQRKSRKKIEQGTGGGGGGGAVGEQTQNASPHNNGASPAESKDARGKGSECSGPRQCPEPQPPSPGDGREGDAGGLVPVSGNSCLCCGAAACKSQPRTAPGSGVKASAPKEKKLQHGSSPASADKGTDTDGSNKARVTRGLEAGLSGRECGNNGGAHRKTCSHLRHKQPPLKPKCRVAAKASRSGAEGANPDLGDRLVASVRSLAERRGPSAARGHTHLGLKEILGFLSTQERLSEEKLTRSKVKVVLEREVARGRLRRTRFGNITLPVLGAGAGAGAGAKPAARLVKSALQGRQSTKKEEKDAEEQMDSDSSEEDTPDEPQKPDSTEPPHNKEDPSPPGADESAMEKEDASPEEGDLEIIPQDLSAVTDQESVPEKEHDCASTEVKEGNLKMDACKDQEMEVDAPISENTITEQCAIAKVLPISHVDLDPSASSAADAGEVSTVEKRPGESSATEDLGRNLQENTDAVEQPVQQEMVCPPVQIDNKNGEDNLQVEEAIVTPAQFILDSSSAQDKTTECMEGVTLTAAVPVESCSSCKMEVGVASCLLTPTASPGDTDVSEERVLNGEIFVKSEKPSVDPMDWTVSDVVSYFTAAGFGEQASAFRMQEIDGKSLLLMQRNDVLTGLSIRLGPALKIYEYHVKELQRTHFQDDSALC